MFVVTPFLSSDHSVFGIYAVCISVSIFLSYADFGFLGAGQKYAAEEFARGNRSLERRILGFSGFVLLIFVILCSMLFVFFGLSPERLIHGISGEGRRIASGLLFILAASAPVTVLQRVTQLIYSVRIEDFIFQRFMIYGSVLKIASTFWFFGSWRYDIVGYFGFVQVMNLSVTVVALVVANRRYCYGLRALLLAFRFDGELFRKMKNLAFSSLFLTISWVLYYECDNFVIGRTLGAESVAIFAIGLTLMTFMRSILGSLFGPFTSRFNHYIGVGDENGLKKSLAQLIGLTFPAVVITICTIVILMKPLIYSWVGPGYSESVRIASLLVCCNLFAFVSYPAAILLSAREKVKSLYMMGAILPLLYWGGVIASYSWLGLEAFGVFKFVAFSVTGLVYLGIILRYLKLSFGAFLMRFVARNIPPLLILGIALFLTRGSFPLHKSKLGLLEVVSFGAVLALLCMACSFLLNPDARGFIAAFRSKKTVPGK